MTLFCIFTEFTGRLLGLFDRHRFGQIPWFVHVCATRQGGVVRQELHRDGVQNRGQIADMARCADDVYAF